MLCVVILNTAILMTFFPPLFLQLCLKKNRWGYCNPLRPSLCLFVRPLCYLLLNNLTKFNRIWCVSYSHEWGVQKQICLAPPLGERSKGQISFNFNYKVNFKDFLYQTLCVFSQMKDINILSGIYILSPDHASGVGL